MAFKGDTTPIKLQLTLTNYAEAFETKPRYHVRQISFMITTLEDVECGTDDVLDYSQFLNAEDQEVLNWQAGTENLQNDVEIRSTLTDLSGRLCPYKNISFSFFDKVTDCDAHQRRTDPRPFSAYRHSTFRSVMLTQHSAADGQVQLLFSCDGLPLDRSCLRWRSHDYIKLEFLNARPLYRVFWLVQWDIVDKTDFMNGGHVATEPGTSLGNNYVGLSLGLSAASQSHGGDSQKFIGTRLSKKRSSPWVAEIRPSKGSKQKIWLGSYKTQEAAARAADSGLYHYGRGRLNFQDSPRNLTEIPSDVNDEEKKKLVQDQAHKLAKLAEKPPSAGMVKFWPKTTKSKGANPDVSAGVLCPEFVQEFIREPTLPPVFNVFLYPGQNSVPDISNDIAEYTPTDIARAGIPDSNDSILHHEIERQMASTGYDSSLLVAELEQFELAGDWARDSYLLDPQQMIPDSAINNQLPQDESGDQTCQYCLKRLIDYSGMFQRYC